MPLVTRQANQGNLFVTAEEPDGWNTGDIWVDTDTLQVSINNNGTAELFFRTISNIVEYS